jgi:hypothetical protein
MANCDTTVFHWVSQYQLMPVWQEYPPPFTAYESYYLEKDRQKFYLGCPDNREVVSYDSHDRIPRSTPATTTTSSQLPPYIVSHSPEGSMVSEAKSEVFSSPYLSNPGSYTSPPNYHQNHQNHMSHWTDQSSVSESPTQPKIRITPTREGFYPGHHDLSLESSDFSQEEIKEEESDDVENSEDESEVFGSLKRKNSYDLSAINEVSQQPRKRQRTTPEQLEVLEKVYEHEKLPNSDLRKELAVKLKMTPRRVQVWFQNKRAKEKRMCYPK